MAVFFAGAFLAGAFFAAAFLAGAFLAGAFFAGAFFAGALPDSTASLNALSGVMRATRLAATFTCLAGRWVARHARRAVDAPELREAGDRDVLAAGNGLRDEFESDVTAASASLRRHVVALGVRVEQLASIHRASIKRRAEMRFA